MEKIITNLAEIYAKIADLKTIQIDGENWLVYYEDEKSGEKWIEEYLFSQMNGGGPPQLRQIEKFPWE